MTKILILGQNPSVREFMAEELAGEGYLVVAIGNPALMGELLSTMDPDLILLDFNLSRMDRRNLLENLKKGGVHLPTFTFTSHNGGREEIRMEMEDGWGVQRFSFETLKQKIPELLRLKPIRGCEWGKQDLLLPASLYSLQRGKGSRGVRENTSHFIPQNTEH